jgi:hypothetical protein
MPIGNTAAMNHHLSEISSQVAVDAHAVVILDCAGWHNSQALVVPGDITLLELSPLQSGAQPGRAGLALSARSLACQLGVYPLGRCHGGLRDGLEPVRHQPQPDRLALCGRLASGFARSIGGTC